MSREHVQSWLKFAGALAVSVFFSYLFLRGADLREIARALAGADYLYVVPAMLLFAGSVALRAVRWQVMYGPDRSLAWTRLLPSLLVGYAGNNLLPLRAGELLRAQHVAQRAGAPWMVTFGTFIMERLFDFMVLSTFVLWGVLLTGTGGAYLGVALALAGATAAGLVVGVVLARRPELPSRLLSRRIPLLSERIRGEAASLSESFLRGFSCLTSTKRFARVLLATATAWGLEMAMYWLVSVGFDLRAGLLTIAFAGAAANVAMSVPSAQGGVGPFQYFAKEALTRSGVVSAGAAAYAVALHIFLVAPVSMAGLLVLWRSALPVSARLPQAPEAAAAEEPLAAGQ